MAYLDVFAVLSILSVWFLLCGWIIYVRVFRFPLKSVTIGYPKLFSFRVGEVEWRIGLLPISSGFDFGEDWLKDEAPSKSTLVRLFNALMPLPVILLWPLLTGIGYGELLDGLRYHAFQMSMAEFAGQYGPLGLADIGALVMGMFPMMFVTGMAFLLRKESLILGATIITYLAWLGLFVRLGIQLYGY